MQDRFKFLMQLVFCSALLCLPCLSLAYAEPASPGEQASSSAEPQEVSPSQQPSALTEAETDPQQETPVDPNIPQLPATEPQPESSASALPEASQDASADPVVPVDPTSPVQPSQQPDPSVEPEPSPSDQPSPQPQPSTPVDPSPAPLPTGGPTLVPIPDPQPEQSSPVDQSQQTNTGQGGAAGGWQQPLSPVSSAPSQAWDQAANSSLSARDFQGFWGKLPGQQSSQDSSDKQQWSSSLDHYSPRSPSTQSPKSNQVDQASGWINDFIKSGSSRVASDENLDSIGVSGAEAQAANSDQSKQAKIRQLGQSLIGGRAPLLIFSVAGFGVIFYVARQFLRDSSS